MQISNVFEKGKANLSGLLNNSTSTSVSDAILTTIVEVQSSKQPNEKTSNRISNCFFSKCNR